MTTNEIIAMAEQAGYPHVGLKWNDQEQAFFDALRRSGGRTGARVLRAGVRCKGA